MIVPEDELADNPIVPLPHEEAGVVLVIEGTAVTVPETAMVWEVAAVAAQVISPLGDPEEVPEATRTYTVVESSGPSVGESATED